MAEKFNDFEWFCLNTTDLFRAAVQKVKIACMISNIRNGWELSEEEEEEGPLSKFPSRKAPLGVESSLQTST